MQLKKKQSRCIRRSRVKMIKLNYPLNQKSIYILACSFGPDSMALFDLLFKANIHFVVCHVNYHRRDVSNFEEMALCEYCVKHHIQYEVLDTTNLVVRGNFQAWAREVRYAFFKNVYEKYNASGLLIAHQQDDSIETFIMQKRRHSLVANYGISVESNMNGMKVIRPLLDYSKQQLKEYDEFNDIPYSIDVSNLTNHYERNRVRHSIIEKMDSNERYKYLNDIAHENERIQKLKETASFAIEQDNSILCKKAQTLTSEEFAYALFKLLEPLNVSITLSRLKIQNFILLLDSKKANIRYSLGKGIYYYQEYGVICVGKEIEPYSYTLDTRGILSTKQFEIDFSMGAEDRGILEDMFPLTIRNASLDDKYHINGYNVVLRRLFIDWKMPRHLRKAWPVILDKNGKIVYIARYRRVFSDSHKSVFKINLK